MPADSPPPAPRAAAPAALSTIAWVVGAVAIWALATQVLLPRLGCST